MQCAEEGEYVVRWGEGVEFKSFTKSSWVVIIFLVTNCKDSIGCVDWVDKSQLSDYIKIRHIQR